MSTPNTAVAKRNEQQPNALKKASQVLAELVGMEPSVMLDTMKIQCFKCQPSQVSNAQLVAFTSICAALGLNPFLPGMAYAYPTREGGVMPMIGPDGTMKLLSEHPDFDGFEIDVETDKATHRPVSATCRIYRKSISRPAVKTVLLSEWRVDSNPNWKTRERHMLEIRALKQCARQIIHGIPYDEDERIIMEVQGEVVRDDTVEPKTAKSKARARLGITEPEPTPEPEAAPVEAEIVAQDEAETLFPPDLADAGLEAMEESE